jgi:hypothetical protein
MIAAAALSSAGASADGGGVEWSTRAMLAGYYDSDDVAVLTPTLEAAAEDPIAGWSARGSYLVDVVSAASVDIVSSASPRWTEVRHAATLGAGYKPGDLGATVSGATSIEPDYVSLAAGFGTTLDLARKHATLLVGYDYEHDIAGRAGTPFSSYSLRLNRHQFRAGAALVLGRATILTPMLDVSFERGRQEKPYRWLPLFDPAVADEVPVGASVDLVNELRQPGRMAESLPESRERVAASLRLAHRFERSTLVLWDRAYADSWGLIASTSDLRWVVELSRRLSIWPRARFHAQSGSSFWRRAYTGSIAEGEVSVPRYRTGDRELGPLWSLGFGSGVGWDFGAEDPKSLSASLELQAIYTDFLDALYIDDRWAAFGVAGLTARF